ELWIRLIYQDNPIRLWIHVSEQAQAALRLWSSEDISHVRREDQRDASADIVLYARHGHAQRDDKSIGFYGPYSGGGVEPISFVLENPPADRDTKQALVYQLIETGILPVIIIDERVQEITESVYRTYPGDANRGESKPMTFWLALMGIYVPRKQDINLE